MNREIEGILADALAIGPATVLTNATLIPRRRAERLAEIAGRSPYTLEIRVSLDGVPPAANDVIRGDGTFDRCLEGVSELVRVGFLPIITAMRSWEESETEQILADFHDLLRGIGYDRPRVKILPPLLIGAEASRTHGYEDTERVTAELMDGFDTGQLLCTRARLATADGVYACPILLDHPAARVADTLAAAVTAPVALSESACFTCYTSGAICSNSTSLAGADR